MSGSVGRNKYRKWLKEASDRGQVRKMRGEKPGCRGMWKEKGKDFLHINTPENNPRDYGKGMALKNGK